MRLPPRRGRARRPLRRRRDGAPGARRAWSALARRRRDRGVPVEPRGLHRPDPGRAGRARGARRRVGTRVVAVSPIVAGAALKGPADRLMAELGHRAVRGRRGPPVRAMGRHARRGRRRRRPCREPSRPRVCAASSRPTVMSTPERAAGLSARAVVDATRLDGRPRLPDRPASARCTPGTRPGRADRRSPSRPANPDGPELAHGDVVVVTQKIVSKAEGRMVELDHDDPAAKVALVRRESVRVLRQRGDLVISETRHGFICANAGVDLSNVARRHGRTAARGLGPLGASHPGRAGEHASVSQLGVIVSDTFGRPWRRGRHRRGHRMRRRGRRDRPEGHDRRRGS